MALDSGGPGGPGSERIRIFLRLRPVTRPTPRVLMGAAEEPPWVEFNVPRNPNEGMINNSRESYKFTFDGLLPPDAQQEEVFDRVALPMLRSALDGYNGTVFAYGQTGSGKTFTITGGAERYADRGLIPRALTALFAEAGRRDGHTYTVHVSYMEIYNETGYDLLDPGREVRALEDLPKVHIMEDEESRMHIRGLSLHRCENEEQALNMLFLGDTNRVVAETPLNQASSRSHCVFTLHIEARRPGEAVVRRSKLNFVDLAGSERVGKTGLQVHTQVKEAKFINLSLHFLEQVIISLQEGRSHTPYRNSVLTMVLRDSLGGNTRTVMVAAVAPEAAHVEESISTCRFAQRVAMISNKVEVNEELDLEVVVKRLKAENMLLRQELQLLRSGTASAGTGTSDNDTDGAAAGAAVAGGDSGEQRQELSEAELHLMRRQVAAFVDDPSPDAVLNVEASMLSIQAAFAVLKGMARPGQATAGAAGVRQGAGAGGSSSGSGGPDPGVAAELRSLRVLVQQQEQQIGVLAGVIRKQSVAAPPGGSGTAGGASAGHNRRSGARSGDPLEGGTAVQAGPASGKPAGSTPGDWRSSNQGGWQQPPAQGEAQLQQQQRPASSAGHAAALEAPAASQPTAVYSDELLADQNKAFEYFCATSPSHDSVAEHKAVLRGRYDEARALGGYVTAAKQRIGELKSAMEQRRLAHSMSALLRQQQQQGRGGGGSGGAEEREEQERAEAEERRFKGMIEQEKEAYRVAYGQLKGVKSEIDGVQASLEHARTRLQNEFQIWYAAMAGSGSSGGSGALGGGSADRGGSSGGGGSGGGIGGQKAGMATLVGIDGQSGKQAPLGQQQQQQGNWSIPAAAAASAVPHVRPSSSSHGSSSSAARWQAEGTGAAPSSWQPGQPYSSSQQQQQRQQSLPSNGTPGAAANQQQQPPYHQQQQQQYAPPQPAPSPPPPEDPYAGVDPAVLATAKPLLTGNAQADADIIKFYQARAELLRGMP